MNIKNKIIKWLGGYTQDELIEQKKIEFCRTEKQIFPIVTEFTIDAEFYEAAKDSTTIEHNLCYQIADFMFNHHIVEYTTVYDEVSDCYIMRAKAYVREP